MHVAGDPERYRIFGWELKMAGSGCVRSLVSSRAVKRGSGSGCAIYDQKLSLAKTRGKEREA